MAGVLSRWTRRMATFRSADEYIKSLEPAALLPKGFSVGTTSFSFKPAELPTKPASMKLTLLSLKKPTASFAVMFTKNAFPGAPIIVGRKHLDSPTIQAFVINNKISNVCAPGGVDDSLAICEQVAKLLGLSGPGLVLPSSTGVIG